MIWKLQHILQCDIIYFEHLWS